MACGSGPIYAVGASRLLVAAPGRKFGELIKDQLRSNPANAPILDEALHDTPPVAPGPGVARSVLVSLPERLRAHQPVFSTTGGLHAAGLFTAAGDLEVLREDVGRHNALDKVIGPLALEGRLPARDRVLAVSGRISFEIIQKAAAAGIPMICAVSAPSSLAVDAARRANQTVVGFLRDERFNLYTGPERVDLER